MDKNLTVPGPGRARRDGSLVLACVFWAAAGAAVAQPRPAPAPANPPMAAPAPAPVFAIRGFKVTGDNPLGEGETTRLLAPFLRTNATIETLQQATAAVEAELRRRGYGLHRVVLPPQEVGDTVTLNIVSFTVQKVTMEGRQIYDEANIRRSVPELQEGRTPNFRRLAVQTAIANENPNKQLQVGIREADEPDKINAHIQVKEERPWTLALSLSNAGSSTTGRDRFTVSGGHTNLFDRDHQFIAAYTTSFARLDDVKQLGLQYKAPLYNIGGVIGASYTRSDVVGNFGTFSSTGAGHTFGLSYTHYLEPDGGRRTYITAGLEDKVFNAAKINDIVVPGTIDRRSRPVSLGYTARTETDTAAWSYNTDLVWNTGAGANNDLASYQSEDPRIDTVRWKAVRGGISWIAPVAGGPWTVGARASYQYSPDVLISGEQFGLGGLGSVRGTSIDRPIAGDKGISASVEATTPELYEGLRGLAFVDAGWVGNNSGTVAKPSSDSIASVGLGLRYTRGRFAAAADYGRIVAGSRVPLTVNAAAPKRGDDRFYLNLSLQF